MERYKPDISLIDYDDEHDDVRTLKDKSYGTITKSSFLKVIDEGCGGQINSETCFVDLGCGKGHLLFYMRDKYPTVKCIGIEYNKFFYKEAIKRRNKYGFSNADIVILNNDIYKLSGGFLDKMTECKNVILFSFDSFFPLDLLQHIKNNIVDKAMKPVTWVNSVQFHNGQKQLQNLIYGGAPGINENDEGIYISPPWNSAVNLDKIEEPPEDDENELLRIKDYTNEKELKYILEQYKSKITTKNNEAYAERWRLSVWLARDVKNIQSQTLGSYNVYVYKKENLMIECMVCEKRRANYVCSCCFVQKYCGENCQRKDWPH